MTSIEYRAWARMKRRCLDPRTDGYHRYGGRGITVCPRWLNSFENFLADMGPRPTDQHSLDRVNNNGNYEPGNCRWATLDMQANNRRANRRLTHNGKSQGVSAWARELGCKPHTITMRLARGWPVALALSMPPDKWGSRRYINQLREQGVKTI